MKITVFIVVFASMQTFALDNYAQTKKMDVKIEESGIVAALEKIEAQSEFFFFYNNKVVKLDKIVSVDLKNKTINEILDAVFKDTDIEYTINNRQIILSGKETGSTLSQQQKSVSGKVTDQSGASLPGITVVVKGTTTGVITDANGSYSLANIPANATLRFSFVGMKSQEIAIAGKTLVNLVMEEESIGIEEIVAVGYGVQKKVNLTGSVTIIKTDELAEISVPSLAQSIMGRSSGVFIKNKKGQPGEDGIDISIRGFGSPLFIVDGTPVSSSYFQQLEPGDIESVNVLKDASAAAVYGARAGNGVILVTTKRGTTSAPKFSYDGNYGLQFFTVVPEYVDAAQYASMYNVGLVNWEGKAPRWSADEIQKFRDGSDPVNYPNTNWWDETFRDYAPQQQHGFSVKGGTESIKYFTSINYFNQKGMHVSDDTDFNRLTMRSNIDIKLSKKINLGFDFALTNQNYLGPSIKLERTSSFDSVMDRIKRSRPFAANNVNPDPSYLTAMLGGLTINPYQMGFIKNVGFNEWNKLDGFAKLRFEYELPYGFAAKAIFDMNRTYNRDKLRMLEMPEYDLNAQTGEYILRIKLNPFDFLQESNSIAKNINQQYFLTWDKTLNNHQFNALFVHEILSDKYDFLSGYRRDFEFDMNYLFAGPDANKNNDGYASEGGRKAYISRINYNYSGKYMVEFSGRWDGSPKFPSDTRWGFFPSASAGWRISEEAFIREHLPVISNLKLRASHGRLGYDAAGQFQYLTTFSVQSKYIYDSGLASGVRANALPNSNITWEKMTTTNAGLDFSLWGGGMLEGSLDYFYRLRSDVLGTRISSLPNVVGATLPQENFYKYDNRGWEITLSHKYKIRDFNYSIGGNISTNREKTIFRDQTNFASMEAYRTGNQNGEWTDRYWAYPTDGLFYSQNEIDNWADIDGQGNRSIKPGDIKYIDYNSDGRISNEDMIVAGRGVMPKLMYGIDISLAWKGFDFMMLWQGAGLFNFDLRGGNQADGYVNPFYAENTPLTFMYENMYTAENPWMPTNTTNAIWPRYGTDAVNRAHTNFNRNADFWLTSGAYIRLKNVQFGYTIPKKITSRWGIDHLKVFVSGYNALTFSKYDFIDPEIDTQPARIFGDSYPIMGSYNFGVQINF